MKIATALLAATVAMLPLSSRAEATRTEGLFFDGNAVLALCRHDAASAPPQACNLYVAGVADGGRVIWTYSKLPALVCIPNGVRSSQLSDIVLTYLLGHPTTRNEGGAGLILVALADAFPCGAAQ